jgi:hypothetical protein
MMAGAMLSVVRRYADDSFGRKIAGSLGGRVVLLPEVVVRSAALSLLIRQSHDESQGDIEARDVFVVEISDLLSDAFASNLHRNSETDSIHPSASNSRDRSPHSLGS